MNDNQYIIGVYQKGTTIYNQQVRALNIFYCLYQLGKITPQTKIGIIGGGVAGTTFACAALHSNMKVSLFETARVLISLQKGCDTREVHPNIYNYPSPNSKLESTDLPICNWSVGTANQMRNSVLEEFQRIRQVFKEKNIPYDKIYFNPNYEVSDITSIIKDTNLWKVETSSGNLMSCDILIYAIGFGIEKELYDNSLSYWQCGILHQEPVFGKPNKNLISGTGDGGLIELITNTIDEFNYKNIIKIIEGGDYNKEIHDALILAKTRYLKHFDSHKRFGTPLKKDFLYREFSYIHVDFYEDIISKLIIKPNDFILHGKIKFEEIFDLDRVSLLNAFLVFLLQKQFTYKSGNEIYNKKDDTFIVEGDSDDHKDYRKWMRRGTNKEALIDKIPGLRDRIIHCQIENKQDDNISNRDVTPLFTNDQFNSIFKRSFNDLIRTATGNSLQFFETFTESLSRSLTIISSLNFRLTIHKIYEVNSTLYYQQIVPYFGSNVSKRHGGFGRLFKWNNGSVGYSVLKGKPLLILRNSESDERDYQRILNNLNLEDKLPNYQKSNKKSILALPVLASSVDEEHLEDQSRTNFVIYIDSEEKDFFEEKTFELLLSSIKGFVATFENLIEKEQIQVYERPHPHKLIRSSDKNLFQGIGDGKLFGSKNKHYQGFLNDLEQLGDNVELKRFFNIT